MTKIGRKAMVMSTLIAFALIMLGSTGATANKRFAGVELEVNVLSVADVDVLKEMLPRFERETGITVKMVEVPYAQWRDTQIMGFLSGTGKPDIVLVDNIWLGEYVTKGWMYPLDDFIKRDVEILNLSDMPAKLLNEGIWKGKSYLLPVLSTVSILFYRKSLFDQAGFAPPEDHQEMIKIGKHFTRTYNPGSPIPYGLVLRYRCPHHIVADFTTFLWSFGSDFFDENWKPILNNEQGMAGADLFLGLFRDYGIVPAGTINYGHDEVITAFQQAQSSMLFTETYTISRVRDPKATIFVEDMAIAPIPGHRDPKTGKLHRATFMGGCGFGINKDSKNKEAAWELVKFIHIPKNTIEFVDRGGSAHYWSVLRNPKLIEKYPFFPYWDESYKTIMGRPRIPEWIEVEYYTGIALSEALTGVKSTKKALDDAAAKIYEIMEKRGYYK